MTHKNPLEMAGATRILVSLWENEKTFSEILMEAKVIPSTLSRQLKNLQELDIIRKNESKEKHVYYLSENGKKLFPYLKEIYVILKKLKMEI
ncbi:MAG: winged helix-turn-helix domain-containing protein [Nanoarchaeota archaeon]|nr:winged helix-turn-helix domain-containing protein [Nanoarchaeota archaeon]